MKLIYNDKAVQKDKKYLDDKSVGFNSDKIRRRYV